MILFPISEENNLTRTGYNKSDTQCTNVHLHICCVCKVSASSVKSCTSI